MFNQVALIGNLGKSPEIRATQDGKRIATLTVATSESWKDKDSGDRKTKSEWHRVVIFSEALVSVAERYLQKGSKVFVQGQLQTRKWTNRDGKDQYSTEVVLQGHQAQLKVLDKTESEPTKHDRAKADGYQPDLDDVIPF